MYKDNSYFLDTDQPSILNMGISRMDLTFWNDIENKGPTQKLFEKNVNLEMFKKFYGSRSLFDTCEQRLIDLYRLI